MPAVVELVETLFGKSPHCCLNPDQVVGLGAAVLSGLIRGSDNVRDFVVTDVADQSAALAGTAITCSPGRKTPAPLTTRSSRPVRFSFLSSTRKPSSRPV